MPTSVMPRGVEHSCCRALRSIGGGTCFSFLTFPSSHPSSVAGSRLTGFLAGFPRVSERLDLAHPVCRR